MLKPDHRPAAAAPGKSVSPRHDVWRRRLDPAPMSNSMHHHLRAVALVAAVVLCAVLPSAADAQVRCNGLPLTMPAGTDEPDVITGTAGRDVIATLGGNDRVFAGPGDDVVC